MRPIIYVKDMLTNNYNKDNNINNDNDFCFDDGLIFYTQYKS